jgi:hypothetical protein
MRKILLITFALAIIFSMSDCKEGGGAAEEEGPFSFIGTWEASGEFVSYNSGGRFEYRCALTFINETEFTHEYYVASKTTTFQNKGKNFGTYAYDEYYITWTDYGYYPSGIVSKDRYSLINKNTLKTPGPELSNWPMNDMGASVIYRRKL